MGTRSEEVHVAGCKAIMRAKGGINQLRERAVAFAVSLYDLRITAPESKATNNQSVLISSKARSKSQNRQMNHFMLYQSF